MSSFNDRYKSNNSTEYSYHDEDQSNTHHGHSHAGGGHNHSHSHSRNLVGHAQPYFSTFNELNQGGNDSHHQQQQQQQQQQIPVYSVHSNSTHTSPIDNNINFYSSPQTNSNNNYFNSDNYNNHSNSNYYAKNNNIHFHGSLNGDSSFSLGSFIDNIFRDNDAKALAAWICVMFLFTIYEIFYGAYLESLGLISDGFHALFDCIGLIISLIGMIVSRKGANSQYSYGYDRWEVLGTFSNGCFLLFVSFFLFLESVERILEPPHIDNHSRIISLAFLSLLINIIGLLFFKRYSNEKKTLIRNENILTITHHILADSCTSLGVISSSLISQIFGFEVSDSIISIIIACIIVYDALPICMRTGLILLQTTPVSIRDNIESSIQKILKLDGVINCTKKNFWSISHGVYIGSVHFLLREDSNEKDLLKSIKNHLSFIQNLTVEFEKEDIEHFKSHQNKKHKEKDHSHKKDHDHHDHSHHDHSHHGHSHNSHIQNVVIPQYQVNEQKVYDHHSHNHDHHDHHDHNDHDHHDHDHHDHHDHNDHDHHDHNDNDHDHHDHNQNHHSNTNENQSYHPYYHNN